NMSTEKMREETCHPEPRSFGEGSIHEKTYLKEIFCPPVRQLAESRKGDLREHYVTTLFLTELRRTGKKISLFSEALA
ncbi:MAG: hypothetical protein KAU44_05395, partial [Candidatus Marinimicrobia bacterium]|nr:hypothetical protein [Candidatus Neomarinimicrobiota bacterium]